MSILVDGVRRSTPTINHRYYLCFYTQCFYSHFSVDEAGFWWYTPRSVWRSQSPLDENALHPGVLVKAQLLKYTWKELTTKNEKPKPKKFSFFAQYLDFHFVLSNRFPRAQYYTGCTLQLSVWSKWPHPFLHRYLKCSSAAVLRQYLECIVCHRLSCCERRSIGRPRSEEGKRENWSRRSEREFCEFTRPFIAFCKSKPLFLGITVHFVKLSISPKFRDCLSMFVLFRNWY